MNNLYKKIVDCEYHCLCQQSCGDGRRQLDTGLFDRLVLANCDSATLPGCQPLGAVVGGVAAQEALKLLSRKYLPLSQWLHLHISTLVISDGRYTIERTQIVKKYRVTISYFVSYQIILHYYRDPCVVN